MPPLEPFCSAKLSPPQPEDTPTKEGFLQKNVFLVTFGVLWLQADEGRGVIYEREYFSLSVFACCKGVSLVLGSPPEPLRGRESLLPFDEIYGAMRDLWDWSWLHQLTSWARAPRLQEVLSLQFFPTNLSCFKAVNLLLATHSQTQHSQYKNIIFKT